MSKEPIFDESTGELLLEPDGIADGEDGCARCDYEHRRAAAHEKRAETMKTELHEAERDLRNKRARITSLENELEKQRLDDDDWAAAKVIFHRWVEWSNRNPKTTKFGEKRSKAVLRALKKYDADFLLVAVEAGVRAANNNNREAERLALIASMEEAIRMLDDEPPENAVAKLRDFYRERVKDVVKFDDLELLVRDETIIERNHATGVRLGLVAGRVNAPELA